MNAAIRRWSVFMGLLFAALLVNLTFIQGIQADELNAAPDNRRVLLDEYARPRGPILVGTDPAARSRPSRGEFEYQRSYPTEELYAHATGYDSFVYGRTSVEQAENAILSGTDNQLFVRRVVDLVTGRDEEGGTVRLTLEAPAQEAAAAGMATYRGAVVAIEPSTGAILAMVSLPSYDPNRLASPRVEEQQEAWRAYTSDPAEPLLNRSIARTLPPGSVFKIVTAAAALENGYTPESVVPGPATLPLPGSTAEIRNLDGQACGPDGQTTLTNALRISCNTAFASIGIELGDDTMRDVAERFGFNSQPLPELNGATSVFPADLDEAQTGQAAIGQFDVRATALQVAMVSAAVANDGVLMTPYLVAETLAPDLAPIEVTEPSEQSVAVSSDVAADLTDMMVTVVADGTGRNAAIPGVAVAGKTGTAESAPDRPPYAWFTSFAPAEDPEVAVAVVVEDAGEAASISGGALGAPVARGVMEAVLAQ